jgi:hypothetical protein
VKRDEQEIEHFFNDKFPRIQRLANKMGNFSLVAGYALKNRLK